MKKEKILDDLQKYKDKAEQFLQAHLKCIGAMEALKSLLEKEELENSKK